MNDRLQRHFQAQASASTPPVAADDSIPPTINRPRLPESGSQSQRPIHQTQTVHRSPVQTRAGLDFIPPVVVIRVESDSDSDGGADSVAEAQHQNQDVTPSTPASSQAGQANSAGGLRSCSADAAAVSNESGAIPLLLTDPDMLDCPICADGLFPPIYQCENGHIACSFCCGMVKNVCPTCRSPIGFIRNLAMEKLIESLRVECKYKSLGCQEMVIYHQKDEHERSCLQIPCSCPISSCGMTGFFKTLYDHFRRDHASSATWFTYDTTVPVVVEPSQKHLFLQEQNEGVIFILNHDFRGQGRVLSIDCIGPGALNKAFLCQFTVRCKGPQLSLFSLPDACAKWQQPKPSDPMYLFIPTSKLLDQGALSIQVRISKAPRPSKPWFSTPFGWLPNNAT